MPRKLLRDGLIAMDEWQYFGRPGDDPAGEVATILTFDQFLADRASWLAGIGRLGVVLAPAHRVEQLAPDLKRFELVAAEFPGPSEGRGYSQARLLRERCHFVGELRAVGHVRVDQVFLMARCGFNSFELPEQDLVGAAAALDTFTARYQPSNDAGLERELAHR